MKNKSRLTEKEVRKGGRSGGRNLEKSFQQVDIFGVNFSATNITETLKATLLIKSSTRTRTVTQ